MPSQQQSELEAFNEDLMVKVSLRLPFSTWADLLCQGIDSCSFGVIHKNAQHNDVGSDSSGSVAS